MKVVYQFEIALYVDDRISIAELESLVRSKAQALKVSDACNVDVCCDTCGITVAHSSQAMQIPDYLYRGECKRCLAKKVTGLTELVPL